MVDFDPDAYLKAKAAVPASGGFDPDTYLRSKGAGVPQTESGAGEATLQSYGNALALGHLPYVQAGAQRAVEKGMGILGQGPEAIDEKLRAQGFKIDSPTYEDEKKQQFDRAASLNKEHPVASAVGTGLGILNTLPIVSAGAGRVAGLLGKAAPAAPASAELIAETGAAGLSPLAKAGLAGAAMSAAQSPEGSQNFLSKEDLLKRGQQGLIGGVAGTTIQAAAPVVGSLVNRIKDSAGKVADAWALKSTGAMLKDMRNFFDKGTVKQISDEMYESGLASPGMNVDKIASKSGDLLKDTGQKIGQIYDKVASSATLRIDLKGLKDRLINVVQEATPSIDKKAYAMAMTPKIKDIVTNPKISDIRVMNDLIGEIDSKINWFAKAKSLSALPEAGDVQKGLYAVRTELRKTVNQIVDATGKLMDDPTMAGQLKELNQKYGNLATINRISRDRSVRDLSNRFVGLLPTIVGSATGVASAAHAAATGNIEHAVTSLALGLAAAGTTKAATKYGAPLIAGGLKAASNFSTSSSPFLKGALPLTPAAAGAVTGLLTPKGMIK